MYRFVTGSVCLGCIVAGVLVIVMSRRFPSHDAKLEMAGTILVVGGLILIGVALAEIVR